MKDEYIIVNKTHILERIAELECSLEHIPKSYVPKHEAQIFALNQILSQSIPLQPVLEQTYEAGKLDKELSLSFDNPKGRYFSSLKLDI